MRFFAPAAAAFYGTARTRAGPKVDVDIFIVTHYSILLWPAFDFGTNKVGGAVQG